MTANHTDFSKAALNPQFAEIRNGVRYFASQHLTAIDRARVEVVEIMPFARPDRNNRIGHIVFHVPANLLQVKNWNGQAIEWLDMANYDYNGFNSSRARLMFGSGYIKLAIRQGFDGNPYISWPRERGKDGQWWDVFKTAAVRYPMFHSDNNYNIQAGLTAYLLTYWGELKRPDVRNRFGFNEHCGNCRHMVYLPIHDGMGHDYENKANSIDTSELTQYGSRMPQWICSVHRDLADEEAVDEINEFDSFEVRSYTDRETGQLRWLRPDQILVKGVPVSTYKMRADGTAERCAECPFYHKNERKADKAHAAELVKAREDIGWKQGDKDPFVPKYWTERAQANRQPVFTFGLPDFTGTMDDFFAQVDRRMAKLNEKCISEGKEVPENLYDIAFNEVVVGNNGQWKLCYPGEMGLALHFMVQGVGNIDFYGTPEINATINRSFVPVMEDFRADDAEVAKVVNMIHHVCNNFATIEPSALETLLTLVNKVAAVAKDPLKSRFDRALARLSNTIALHE